ncbi:PspC domain-containing protein [Pelolinea submarina]|uniref:Phage shock protein C (PspC) family protein n=1 Tax=Pelolinea submarina TaxID=913107 RepID=A0A3E0AAP1_9CHLR|nr:PspC domain-containing protein [Pelolinea submarina]REG08525.1 phage shock protein C (PspC) family protein [Pelolinea submarina]
MKKLYRSNTDRMIAGVCAGLADYINIDPTIIRLIFVVLFLMGTGGFWIYIILWAIVPLPPDHADTSIEVTEVREVKPDRSDESTDAENK